MIQTEQTTTHWFTTETKRTFEIKRTQSGVLLEDDGISLYLSVEDIGELAAFCERQQLPKLYSLERYVDGAWVRQAGFLNLTEDARADTARRLGKPSTPERWVEVT